LDPLTAAVEQGEGLTFFTIENGRRQDHAKIMTTWVNYKFKAPQGMRKLFYLVTRSEVADPLVITDCARFQELLYGWDLKLIIPVSMICRPHRGRDDENLVGQENIRVWQRGSELQFMAHLKQEKGKRRRKYLEFDRT
jgi:hypothetical protein